MKTLYAYLAGALEADGFVTVQRVIKRVRGNYQPSLYYRLKVGFSQTNKVVPSLFHRTFGGSFYEYQPKNQSHKRWFSWQVGEQVAAEALRSIVPFLRWKKRQAVLAISLADLTKRQWVTIKKNQKPPYRIPPKMQAQRQRLWMLVTSLNNPKNRRVHLSGTPAPVIPRGTSRMGPSSPAQ